MDDRFMLRAIALAVANVQAGGGPFGAVIVRGDEIVGEGVNRVTVSNDPTAHAEMEAIRSACGRLGDFRLRGCTIYASCEPCPMCLGAIHWARLDRVYYGASREDAASAGFDDSRLYGQAALRPDKRTMPMTGLMRDEALEAFRAWAAKSDRIVY